MNWWNPRGSNGLKNLILCRLGSLGTTESPDAAKSAVSASKSNARTSYLCPPRHRHVCMCVYVCVCFLQKVFLAFLLNIFQSGLGFFFFNHEWTLLGVSANVCPCSLRTCRAKPGCLRGWGEKTIYFTPAAVTRFLIQSGIWWAFGGVVSIISVWWVLLASTSQL